VTEYTDHFRNARLTESRMDAGYSQSQARAENAVTGTGDRLKSQALEVLLEVTSGLPEHRSLTFANGGQSLDAAELGLI
jgi:hypothetical protein